MTRPAGRPPSRTAQRAAVRTPFRPGWLLLVAAAAAVALGATGATGTARAAEEVFRNDFDAGIDGFAPVIGQRDVGGRNFGTGELSDFTSTNHTVADGVLTITPSKSDPGAWNSTRLESTRLWSAPAGGWLEAAGRLQLPAGERSAGLWPALWLLGDGAWPAAGEMDLVEQANGQPSVLMALHCGTWSDADRGPCNEPTGLTAQAEPGSGFHDYTLRIDRTQPGAEFIAWSIDGQERFRVSRGTLPDEALDPVLSNSFRLILNVAVGGALPEAAGVSNATLDALPPGPRDPLLVDWVEIRTGP